MTYSDLSEMYQLNMNNLYFRGVREVLLPGNKSICAGVMLMNLKLIRENHVFDTFKKYYMDKEYIKKYEKINPIIYTQKELIKANNKPIIRHIWGITKEGLVLKNKPWLLKKTCGIKKVWQYYAQKTGYYSSICKKYKNAC